MLNDDEFTFLMNRARTGDQDAATELVRLYEPEIRRAARLRMTDPEMRQLMDSMDITQSVLGRFFRTMTERSEGLTSPHQLLAFLTTMTRNRIIDEHRRRTALKRGGNNFNNDGAAVAGLFDDAPGLLTETIARDLLEKARKQFSDAELELADRRTRGDSWKDISKDVGESPEALRKRLERALDRVRGTLNSDDD